MYQNKAKIKRALVTGATGFVGSNIARALLLKGLDVHIIVRPHSSLNMLLDIKNNIKVHVFDGGIDQMLEIMTIAHPDIVFHVASMVIGEHKSENIEGLVSSNILFGSLLLEAMMLTGVKSLINTGTYWEHYQGKPYSPVNLYAATKYAFQNILQYYVEASGIKVITLKLLDPYGKNDPRPKLLNLLFKIAGTGEELVMTPGMQKIDLVHINDIVNAYLSAANRLFDCKVKEHEVYEVSTGNQVTLKKLVALIEEKTNKKINIIWAGKPYKDREVMVPLSGFSHLPDWKPEITLEKGIDDIFSLDKIR